jgi:hypothetical protein
MDSLNLKKSFLYLLMVSVAISVVIGILVVLLGTAEQSSKIFLTSLTITVASFSMFLNGVFFEKLMTKVLPVIGFLITPVCAIVCITSIWGVTAEYKPLATAFALLGANFFLIPMAFYFEKKHAKLIPLIGLLATLVTTGFTLSLIWDLAPQTEAGRKIFLIIYLIALACFYLSLILRVNLIKKFQWSLPAVQVCVGMLVALYSSLIAISAKDDLPSEFFYRSMTILAILITALTVIIPIFHFLSRSAVKPDVSGIAEIDQEMARLKRRLAELEETKREIENRTPSAS